MSKASYMVIHQLNGNLRPYANSRTSLANAEMLFNELVSDPCVSSAWVDKFTNERRETVAYYHNKGAAKQALSTAGEQAAQRADAHIFAPAV